MFYHASKTPYLRELTPRISNHGKPLVYFSKKRENVLVYLSNAVEKHCKQAGFNHIGTFTKWASYGFNKQGILVLSEYYPNATIDTYKGESGYVYTVQEQPFFEPQPDIPDAVIAKNAVAVHACEPVADAYEEIKKAADQGKIIMRRFADNSPELTDWIRKNIVSEYEEASEQPEYRFFLKSKFDFL